MPNYTGYLTFKDLKSNTTASTLTRTFKIIADNENDAILAMNVAADYSQRVSTAGILGGGIRRDFTLTNPVVVGPDADVTEKLTMSLYLSEDNESDKFGTAAITSPDRSILANNDGSVAIGNADLQLYASLFEDAGFTPTGASNTVFMTISDGEGVNVDHPLSEGGIARATFSTLSRKYK